MVLWNMDNLYRKVIKYYLIEMLLGVVNNNKECYGGCLWSLLNQFINNVFQNKLGELIEETNKTVNVSTSIFNHHVN